jgi:hypothetical protein
MRTRIAAALSLTMVSVVLAGCDARPRSAPGAAAAGVVPPLDSTKVPPDLRGLVSLAQEWGIGDDVDRGAKAQGASAADKARVRAAVAPYQDRITAWLNSFGQNLMPDEAAAFMYLQLAIEEMGPPVP